MDLKVWQAWQDAVKAGDVKVAKKLKDKLVIDNSPLAVLIANRYKRYTKTSTEIEDLSQAGIIGVLKAFDKYDPTRAKFSTYATFIIISEIQKCIHKDRKINLPRNKKSEDHPMKFTAEREAKKIEHNEDYDSVDHWDNYAALVSVLTPAEMEVIESLVFDDKNVTASQREIFDKAKEKIAEKARALYVEGPELQ